MPGSCLTNPVKQMQLDKEVVIVTDVPKIYEDNDGARKLAKSGMGEKWDRYLSVKHDYAHDLYVWKGSSRREEFPPVRKTADLFTKGSRTR